MIVWRFVMGLVLLAGLVGPAAANPVLLLNSATGEVLYADEAGKPWHPASLTKMMTAFIAFEAIAQGRIGLDTRVTLSRRAVAVQPSKSGLAAGSSVSMEDALYILLVKSANDMAVAIAETISGSEDAFVAEMNTMARALGMSATHYANAHGLHDVAQVTTARDLAVLALYIRQRHPRFLPIFATGEVRIGKARLESNNDLLEHFAGTTGMKTGFVCASGLNIVATVDRGMPLMAVILGAASARERGEMAAQMFLRAMAGGYSSTGSSILSLANEAGAPANMRPQLCGPEAKAYLAERDAAFPMGLRGQPSYLTDNVALDVHVAVDLGRLRDNIPLPLRRPDWAPVAPVLAKSAEMPAPVATTRLANPQGAPIPLRRP